MNTLFQAASQIQIFCQIFNIMSSVQNNVLYALFQTGWTLEEFVKLL